MTPSSTSTTGGSPIWKFGRGKWSLKRRSDKPIKRFVHVLVDLAIIGGLLIVASVLWGFMVNSRAAAKEAVIIATREAVHRADSVATSKLAVTQKQVSSLKVQQQHNTRAINNVKFDRELILREHNAIKRELEACRIHNLELEKKLLTKSREFEAFRKNIYAIAGSARGAAYHALDKVEQTRHEVGLKP